MADILGGGARILSGCHARWLGPLPDQPTVFFANHTSHLDALVIWSSLPRSVRRHCRMVAAADYWMQDPIRRWVAMEVFRAVPVERNRVSRESDPLAPLQRALDAGDSLIFFPEGGRQTSGEIGTFKSGLWRLAMSRPSVRVRPVWLENLNRILPKGSMLPVPIIAAATFGPDMEVDPNSSKKCFLELARQKLMELQEQQP